MKHFAIIEPNDPPSMLTHEDVSAMVGYRVTIEEANTFRLDIGGSLVDLYEAQQAQGW